VPAKIFSVSSVLYFLHQNAFQSPIMYARAHAEAEPVWRLDSFAATATKGESGEARSRSWRNNWAKGPGSMTTSGAGWPPRPTASVCHAFAKSPLRPRCVPLLVWHRQFIARKYDPASSVRRAAAFAGTSARADPENGCAEPHLGLYARIQSALQNLGFEGLRNWAGRRVRSPLRSGRKALPGKRSRVNETIRGLGTIN
jgi:hypothetical protein